MKALLRNCLHHSNVYIIEECDREGNINFIYKSSSTKQGINSLKQESSGSIWYRRHNGTNFEVSIEAETKNYIRVKSLYINGTTFSPESGFSNNKAYLPSILEHYCSTWLNSSTSDLYSLHGDFSIGNIIFCKSSPTIIDWEHFRENICPIGFDGLNLLFEQLWFEGEGKRLNQTTIEELSEMINLLRERGALALYFLDSPLKMVIHFIRNNSKIWNEQDAKLPVLKFTDYEVLIVDGIINKIINQ
jgi:hypothetical protein